jgi:hypothetical protein
MMKDFHKAFAKAEKREPQDTILEEKPEPESDESMISGPATMPQVSEPEEHKPVFCRLNQPCYLPRELFSARTVMVCDPIHSCNDGNMQQDVAWGGRWKLVDDPAKADLVLVLCWTPSNGSDAHTFVYTGLYIFKGGEQPDWNSLPIYLQFGRDHEIVLKDLEKMVAEAR